MKKDGIKKCSVCGRKFWSYSDDDRFGGLCGISCLKMSNQTVTYSGKKEKTIELLFSNKPQHKKKLEQIKEKNCTCPGCGECFSGSSDIAILMIFESSHIHTCGKSNERFWSCRNCNRLQRNNCGYWKSPGLLVVTCPK